VDCDTPDVSEVDKYVKFMAERNKVLATIVLSVDPTLRYLLGDSETPVIV